MAPEEEVVRGGRAAELLDSAIFKEAKQHVLDTLTAQMRKVPMSDQTMHTRLIVALQCWDAFERFFEQLKQTGEMAQIQLAQEEQKRKWYQLNR